MLDSWVDRVNSQGFIANDPITIPHRFSVKQDIEIAGFFAAIMAWGSRTTIINKCSNLLERMDNEPYDFLKNHSNQELKKLEGFVHRTLNDTDLLYLIDFLSRWYDEHNSLENAFTSNLNAQDATVENGLVGFYNHVFSASYAPKRTQKHIATPAKKSACKRLNMYLRWMVRSDNRNVDFGIWKNIKTSQLICPLDVHVHRVALGLGIMNRKQPDWLAAIELTEQLSRFDPEDPVKYDFALFGMGVSGEQIPTTL